MAIVTLFAYAKRRANTSLRSAAMQLSRMLHSNRYSKGSSFTLLKDHTLHPKKKDGTSKEEDPYALEGGKYEESETEIHFALRNGALHKNRIM